MEAFLQAVLDHTSQQAVAEHGEGFWTDHWTYNLDLIESYLAIFPEKEQWLFYDSALLAFFDSEYVVQPREYRYVLSEAGPQQSNAVVVDPEKAALIQGRDASAHWVRSDHGHGEVFRVPLISKLVLLALLKFSTLDPDGLGIEMEAGKPGWCDALNGLPGMFGSSMAETYELLRLLRFLERVIEKAGRPLNLPAEAGILLQNIIHHLEIDLDPFTRWDAITGEREAYRQATKLGFDGETIELGSDVFLPSLKQLIEFVENSIKRANDLNDGLPATYFYYQVEEYEVLDQTDEQGRSIIRPQAFRRNSMPVFLEGCVRYMKLLDEPGQAHDLHLKVKNSALYDRDLKMYRLNASLQEQPHSIGRIRAFTPGWLENESIFLHMSYKYVLELMRAGLAEEFFEEMQTQLVPFIDPQVYGRSVLENSSFLASSAHPDPSIHGTGFVARLTGATTEFLSMWGLMMIGERPFFLEDGELQLAFRPNLPGWLFREDGRLSFRFLGHTQVTYHHASGSHLVGQRADRIILTDQTGQESSISSGQLRGDQALMVRDGKVPKLDLYFHEV
jgi:hypothetical protein